MTLSTLVSFIILLLLFLEIILWIVYIQALDKGSKDEKKLAKRTIIDKIFSILYLLENYHKQTQKSRILLL